MDTIFIVAYPEGSCKPEIHEVNDARNVEAAAENKEAELKSIGYSLFIRVKYEGPETWDVLITYF